MTEQPDNPPALDEAQREEYRQMLAESLEIARAYRGDEESFQALIAAAGKLDDWQRQAFGEGGMIAPETEVAIAESAGARRCRTIDDILDVANERFRKVMASSSGLEGALQQMDIVYTHIEGVLLPPGTGGIVPGDGTGTVEKPQAEPRVERLIVALQQHGIFTDDLIVTAGSLSDTMMRRTSYVLIEIPRIGREVLVCNQVGEATFVCRRRLGLATYLSHTKEELDEIEGVERIVSHGTGKWEADVLEALLRDISAGETKKIDVTDFAALRQEILLRIPTGEQWMQMIQREKKTFKIAGSGERAIATALGLHLKRDPTNNSYEHALLGEAIYGSNDPAIALALATEREWMELEKDRSKLIGKVRELCPDGEQWMQMPLRGKNFFKIAGSGERAIATALGLHLKRDPTNNSYEHALLGEAIYGSNDPAIALALATEREWMELEKDRSKLIGKVRELCPDGEQWMQMIQREKKTFKIAGRGEAAIAAALNLQLGNKPVESTYAHALLGEAIYGSNDPAIALALVTEREWMDLGEDRAKLIAKIHESYPSGEQWMQITRREKGTFKIAGRGEVAIATALGLQMDKGRDPIGCSYVHALLGEAIYGSNDPAIQQVLAIEREWMELKGDRGKLIENILQVCPTREQWMKMSREEKHAFEVVGRGEEAIAAALGLELRKSPTDCPYEHALIGEAIYGSNDPAIQKALQKEDGGGEECSGVGKSSRRRLRAGIRPVRRGGVQRFNSLEMQEEWGEHSLSLHP